MFSLNFKGFSPFFLLNSGRIIALEETDSAFELLDSFLELTQEQEVLHGLATYWILCIDLSR